MILSAPACRECQIVQDDHGDAVLADVRANHAHDVKLVAQIKGAGRLIEQQEWRPPDDRLCKAC
jgi:hypothetical protein